MKHELLALETTNDIVSFKKLFSIIFRMKWFILFITLAFAVGSVYIAMGKPNVYTAKGIFVPAQSDSGGGLSQLAGQFGGLAGIAGISLGGGKGDDNAIALQLLKSRSFLQSFIEKRNLLPQLLAATKWDQASDSLIYNEELYNAQEKKWVRGAPPGRKIIPTPWEGYYTLLSLIQIEYISKKGYINISVTYLSPELATKWLTWLVADLNSYWRLQEKKLADDSIEYLQQQVATTNNSEMLTIFYSIIAEQTQKTVLAEVRKEYLFKTLAPIVTPEEKSGPSRALIAAAGTFLGALLSLLFSFVYVNIRPEKVK
ncbi:Wzz/FepE/Etk N-terminal domain-containing protein [Colwellia sp. TT2012]|uniref:Wzz/FepE/Etk N-terminal domain-containing protein n=1 Tax=Colwellia sp. TT2012 TaxID=1720342 RepID=UPI00070CB533|nr:Wzz/FepE/Etk N-terminal domain-containing protein [Colwellia sp. TT2012]